MTVRREERLNTVTPALADVVRRAATYLEFDILVVEGARTVEKQREYVAKGASRTMNSKHIPDMTGYSRAVDLAPQFGREARWDWPLFHIIAVAMKRAANELGVKVVWGGDWKSFKDGPQWELA